MVLVDYIGIFFTCANTFGHILFCILKNGKLLDIYHIMLRHFYLGYIVMSFIWIENRSTGENHRPATYHCQTLTHKPVSSTPQH